MLLLLLFWTQLFHFYELHLLFCWVNMFSHFTISILLRELFNMLWLLNYEFFRKKIIAQKFSHYLIFIHSIVSFPPHKLHTHGTFGLSYICISVNILWWKLVFVELLHHNHQKGSYSCINTYVFWLSNFLYWDQKLFIFLVTLLSLDQLRCFYICYGQFATESTNK